MQRARQNHWAEEGCCWSEHEIVASFHRWRLRGIEEWRWSPRKQRDQCLGKEKAPYYEPIRTRNQEEEIDASGRAVLHGKQPWSECQGITYLVRPRGQRSWSRSELSLSWNWTTHCPLSRRSTWRRDEPNLEKEDASKPQQAAATPRRQERGLRSEDEGKDQAQNYVRGRSKSTIIRLERA